MVTCRSWLLINYVTFWSKINVNALRKFINSWILKKWEKEPKEFLGESSAFLYDVKRDGRGIELRDVLLRV